MTRFTCRTTNRTTSVIRIGRAVYTWGAPRTAPSAPSFRTPSSIRSRRKRPARTASRPMPPARSTAPRCIRRASRSTCAERGPGSGRRERAGERLPIIEEIALGQCALALELANLRRQLAVTGAQVCATRDHRDALLRRRLARDHSRGNLRQLFLDVLL